MELPKLDQGPLLSTWRLEAALEVQCVPTLQPANGVHGGSLLRTGTPPTDPKPASRRGLPCCDSINLQSPDLAELWPCMSQTSSQRLLALEQGTELSKAGRLSLHAPPSITNAQPIPAYLPYLF